MQPCSPTCPSCSAAMDEGYLVDHGYGAVYPVAWTAGRPRWSRFLGLRLKSSDKVPVATFRCPDCGLLASYAREGKWPG